MRFTAFEIELKASGDNATWTKEKTHEYSGKLFLMGRVLIVHVAHRISFALMRVKILIQMHTDNGYAMDPSHS